LIAQPRRSIFDTSDAPHGAGRRAHLIGAAGSGMRSLATVLSQAGWQLTGSDLNADTAGAGDALIDIGCGHSVDRIHAQLNLVLFSDATTADNPERRQAGRLGIPAMSYPAALGALMLDRRGLAIAGTHGKSTTAAMLAEILESAGTDPTYVFGAARQDLRPGGRLGSGEWMIAEACEYRANFCHLAPEIAVLLGVEPDHFDYYRSEAELDQAFTRFVAGISPLGWLVFHAGCARACRVAAKCQARSESFGFDPGADWQATPVADNRGCFQFTVRYRGAGLGSVQLGVPGRHNVLDALAAAAAAHHAGASWQAICAGLEAFAGLHRRLETIVDGPRLAVVDDFAHLPAEVAAGLAAVRLRYPRRRVWCVFQPHQVSRTTHLLDELADSLQNADKIIVADIFRAREGAGRPGEVTAADLAARVAAAGGGVVPAHADGDILSQLFEGLQAGDVLVTMGAGNIGKIANAVAERIRKNHTPQ
jgi:UDP-N-acetylmuramate--alanine ligase